MQTPSERLAWRLRHDFDAQLEELEAEIQADIAAVGDVSNGAVLRHERAAMWTFVLCDLQPGKWRVQVFDPNGFSGHSLWNSADEAVRFVLTTGYRHRDDGALDRVAALPSFERGNYVTDLVQRVNRGELSVQACRTLVDAYDAAHPALLSPS
jgi:hypothetical protein